MKNRHGFHKVLASALAAAMFITSVPIQAFATEADDGSNIVQKQSRDGYESNLIASFNFDDDTNGFTGAGAVAEKVGSNVTLEDHDDGKAVYLGSNSYLSITDEYAGSLLTGLDELTISYDAKPNQTGTNWIFYAAPNTNQQTYNSEKYLGILAASGSTKVERYLNSGSRPNAPSATTGTDWAHVDVVINAAETTIYVDGVKGQTVSSSYALTDILGSDSLLYIGKANWESGEYSQMWIDNLEIYNVALPESELISTEKVQAAVDADLAALTLADSVTKDFTLPTTGDNGCDISWEITNGAYASIVDNTVVISRQTTDEDISLRATISMYTVSATKDFTVTILREFTDDDVIAAASASLDIADKDAVRGNIYLPEEIEVDGSSKTASVTWSSDNPSVVSADPVGDKPAGVVNRQSADTTVKMTASISCDTGTPDTKEIELTVKAAYTMDETTSYLFSFFSANTQDKEQIFYATSEDGDNWMDLYADQAILDVSNNTEYGGNKGVRDPYIMRSAEGDKFYMLATDLCAGLQGFATGLGEGSRSLVIWESYDLVNWSEPWLVEVAPEKAGNAWAPEAYYDEETGEYLVFWASIVYEAPYNDGQQRVYYCKTRDFINFTEPELYIERVTNGTARHIIDTNIIDGEDGHYYRISTEDGTLTIDKSLTYSLLGEWEELGSLQSYIGTTIYGDSGALEGPEFFKYNSDDLPEGTTSMWGMMADRYGSSKGYIPYKTTDIGDASAWTKPEEDEFNYDTMLKRHGGILQITDEEYARVMEAYGPNSITVKTVPTKKTYQVGDTLDLSGLVLNVSYLDGTTETVSYNSNEKNQRQFTTDVEQLDTLGTQTVMVTYGDQSTTFEVNVTEDGGGDDEETKDPVLEYTFENDLGSQTATDSGQGDESSYDGSLFGNAAVVYDEDRASNVLELDGTTGSYAEIPQGFFDGRDTMTISMDVKSELDSGDFFTFTYGKNSTYYNFLRIRGKSIRNAITVNSYNNEKEVVTGTGASTGVWQNVVIVFEGTTMKLYVDGALVSTNSNTGITTSNLGSNLLAYLGKSFYSPDGYFKGSYDNFKVYDRVLSDDEIINGCLETASLLRGTTIGTVPEDPSNTMGTDDHTAVTSKLNKETMEVTSYIRKNADITNIPLTLDVLSNNVTISVEGYEDYQNGDALDLSGDIKVTLTYRDAKEEWIIKAPATANNPVLSGQYADPDIDYFDGKYWIYPTTDGYSGWGGTQFHAFSSVDLVNWVDEGVIVDLTASASYENDNGVAVATVDWASGNAWAPSIEEKNGKYYFYFCGNNGNAKAIGVAVADNPAGPFVAESTPLLTIEECNTAGISMGQVIDPSIFTDDDGTSYMLFGNGNAAIVELNDDMVSWKSGTLQNLSGLTDFRESVIVTKKDGIYHFTWSCDDTGSSNYHVKYGTSTSLYGPVTYKYVLLQKDEDGDMLGTAHHSIVENNGKYYIAYHRFYTPIGVYTDGLGYHRETCIDELVFGDDGLMQPVTPTMEGVKAPEYVTVSYTAGTGGKIEGTATQTIEKGTTTTEVTAVALEGYTFSKWSDGNTSVTRTDTATVDADYQAIFVKIEAEYVTISYTAGTGGKIEGTATQTVEKGTTTTKVTAVASSGYTFSKWSDGSTSATRTDTATANATYQATFVKTAQTQAEKDQAAAAAVEKLINAIGTVTYTDASKAKIAAARSAYDKLTAAQKKLVSNSSKLTSAETSYQTLKTKAEAVKKGQTYTVGNYKYKVTNVKKATVTVTGVTKKSLKTIKVKNTVKIKGTTFKVTAIGNGAFKNCKKATKATIGKNVKTIGKNAFSGCKKLKKVTINSTVLTKIGNKAFYNCTKLKSIVIKSKKLKSVGSKAFKGIHAKAKIKVPKAKLSKYKKLMKNKGQKSTVKIVK